MANTLIRKIVKTYVPGTPGVPPVPARCYQVASEVPVNNSGLGSPQGGVGSWEPVYGYQPPTNGGTYGVAVESGYPTGTRNLMRFVPDEQDAVTQTYTRTYTTVCEPAKPGVPGTPPKIIESGAGPDWLSSAVSRARLDGDLKFTCVLNDRPTLIVGFTLGDTGPSIGDVAFGIMLSSTPTGASVRPVVTGVAGASVGNYSPGDTVKLLRAGDKFVAVVGDTLLYSTDAVNGAMRVDAMLYTSSDMVDDPVFTSATVGGFTEEAQTVTAAEFIVAGGVGFTAGLSPALGVGGTVGFSGTVHALVDGEAVIQVPASIGFTVDATVVRTDAISATFGVGFTTLVDPESWSGASLVLNALQLKASEEAYSDIAGVLPALEITAYGGAPSTSVSGMDAVLSPLGMYASSLVGELGSASLRLRSLSGIAAEGEYAQAALELPPMFMYADDGFGIEDYYGWNQQVKLRTTIATEPVVLASIYGDLDLGFDASVAAILDATAYSELALDPDITFEEFISLAIESGISLATAGSGVPSGEYDPTTMQYVFNALTGAVTRYQGFEFDSFAQIDGVTYGAAADGLHEINYFGTGELNALVDFGATAFGVGTKKNIETMFIGMATDGTVYAKLSADLGEERVYRVLQRYPTMKVRPGRGITAREWTVRLEVVDATSAVLDDVTFVVGASTRRWTK